MNDLLIVKFIILCIVCFVAIIVLGVVCFRIEQQMREIEQNSESIEDLTRRVNEAEQRFIVLRSHLEFTTADEYWQVKRELDELKRRLKAKQNG